MPLLRSQSCPPPPVFTKLLKVPITLLRKLNIRYPSNGSVITRDINSPGHIDLLFQNLGFLINIEKSVLTPATKIEFLGMKVEVFLPQEKVDGIIDMCQDLLSFERASLRMIASGRKAVIPAPLNVLADKEPRNVKDSSEWKLEPQSFQRIIPALGNPEIDLIASRVSVQIPCYMAWKYILP